MTPLQTPHELGQRGRFKVGDTAENQCDRRRSCGRVTLPAHPTPFFPVAWRLSCR